MYKLTIECAATSLENVKFAVNYVADKIANARTEREVSAISGAGGGGSGSCTSSVSYRVTLTSPVELQIRTLRAEADRLEAELLAASNKPSDAD